MPPAPPPPRKEEGFDNPFDNPFTRMIQQMVEASSRSRNRRRTPAGARAMPMTIYSARCSKPARQTRDDYEKAMKEILRAASVRVKRRADVWPLCRHAMR